MKEPLEEKLDMIIVLLFIIVFFSMCGACFPPHVHVIDPAERSGR